MLLIFLSIPAPLPQLGTAKFKRTGHWVHVATQPVYSDDGLNFHGLEAEPGLESD